MPRYNDFYYGLGVGSAYYGTKSPLAFSAEPITATAINYGVIGLTWLAPFAPDDDQYDVFRLVRSQDGLPQTQEDGIIIYESNGTPIAPSASAPFVDGGPTSENKIIEGRFVFYRAWVKKKNNGTWVDAGSAYTLVPSPHNLSIGRDAKYTITRKTQNGQVTDDGLAYFDPRSSPFISSTHERFLSVLPRVITSGTNSGLDVPESTYSGVPGDNSLLPSFLSAFSFTLDEMLTFAALVTPDTSVHWSSPTSILLGSQELGMTLDVEPVTPTQRRLLRNSVPIYGTKGTSVGLQLLAESMTGYDTQLSDTVNLLLSHEDSTFNLPGWRDKADFADNQSPKLDRPSIGTWSSLSSGLVLDVVSDQVGETNADLSDDEGVGQYCVDTVYCLKATTSTTSQAIALGTLDPRGTGIPVTAGKYYALSEYWKASASSSTVGVEIKWYDRRGLLVSSTTATRSSIGTTWVRKSSYGHLAPLGAVYAGIVYTFNQNRTYYLDAVQFEETASISATATNYQEPRGVIVQMNPYRMNLISNPGFHVDTADWAAGTAGSVLVRNSTTGFYGSTSLSVTCGSGSDLGAEYSGWSASPETDYAASIYVKGVSQDVDVKLYLSFDVDGDVTEYESEVVTASVSGWSRVSVVAKSPSTSLPIIGNFLISSDEAVSAGVSILVDAAMLEEKPDVMDYFDGSMSSEGGVWGGSIGASTSGLYPALSNRVQRFITEAPDYIGLNTPYFIELFDSKTRSKGIT